MQRRNGHSWTRTFVMGGTGFDLVQAFATDAQRLEKLSQQAPYVFADLSKNWLQESTEQQLSALARACGVHTVRDAMLGWGGGQHDRGARSDALALRTPPDAGLLQTHPVVQAWDAPVQQALQQVHSTLDAMLALAEQVRSDERITDVVNIGIGGSHLGPEVVVQALEDWVAPGKNFHFVSNVDGHELGHVLRKVKPQSTLFLIASKSFTTAETMLNAHSARTWFSANGGTESDIQRHFVALTTNTAAAAQFGRHAHTGVLGLGGRTVFVVVCDWPADCDCDWCRAVQKPAARCACHGCAFF